MTRAHITTTGIITKPLLAARVEDGDNLISLKFPVGITNKIDGLRCLKIDGKAVSRTFKPIPNHYIRRLIEKHMLDGMDMEIVAGSTFSQSTGNIMREEGEPTFTVHIIDYVPSSLSQPYQDRMKLAYAFWLNPSHDSLPFFIKILMPVTAYTVAEIEEYERKALAEGHEGVMIRDLKAPYKCGRSTFKEGILIKLKRFSDAEATVIGVEELYHNDNEAKEDAFGRTKRATVQDNLRPGGTLGALVVKGCGGDYDGVQFKIGTGFDKAQRQHLWGVRRGLPGKIVKFTYFPTGTKDAPRFPAFVGFRDPRDMDAR
jgi:DNA ligase-1